MPHASKKGASPAERHADPARMHDVVPKHADEEEPNMDELERLDQEAEARVVSLSSADVERLRQLTPEKIAEMDAHIQYAIEAFFSNRIADCEAALRKRMSDDPLAVCGAGLIAFLRCALSMEQAQADVALELLTKSSGLAAQVMPSEKSMLSRGFAKVFQRKKDPKSAWLSAAEFRAKTTYAESQALRCFVLVLQQSVPSLLKAGLALNRANGSYKALYAELEQRYTDKYGCRGDAAGAAHRSHGKKASSAPAASPVSSPDGFKERDASLEESAAMDTLGLDRNSVHCVEFGLGAICLALSILPDSVRALLRFIGVDGNRQDGLRLARHCFKSDSLLSPFASALLLALYGMLPAISAFLVGEYLPVVQEVRAEALQKESMRESLLHLWLDGRVERLTRNIELSTAKLNHTLEVASNPQLLAAMPQLRDFAVYDQSFNYATLHQWKRASRCLEILSKTSKWANAVYQYTQACCLEMLETEWAEGIANPDGDVDFPVDDLHRLVGATKVEERKSITFCDLASRAAVGATITGLYWAAAQRKPVSLGGKPNHMDQFVLKRMEEMLSHHGITPTSVVAKKKLGEALEPVPAGLVMRNIVPLPAYEMCLIVGTAHQYPAPIKDKIIARVDGYLLRESVVADTPLADYIDGLRQSGLGSGESGMKSEPSAGRTSPATSLYSAPEASPASHEAASPIASPTYATAITPLPDNYRVLCLAVYKALLLANSESKSDRRAALHVIDAIRKTPQYKDRQWTLSYAQAFVLYEKAYVAYRDEGLEAAETILSHLHKQYDSAHYFVHAKMDLKAHLASYQLHAEREARAEAQRGK